ncbi:MAG: DUF1854 domain-containing protein [Planctomycetes bacterium]|nr:DUF1854 domain-containing protein [Planctomycetota bacterium]
MADDVAMTDAGLCDGSIDWLTPENAHVYEGAFSMLCCAVNGAEPVSGVFAIRLFPASFPDSYIALLTDTPGGGTTEVGIIQYLEEFPVEEQALVRSSLARHYHEQVISRVHKVECRNGLLFFDVDTQRGREQFVMRWEYDRAQEYGANGKLLLDVEENRFLITDLAALPAVDKRRFTRHIYW